MSDFLDSEAEESEEEYTGPKKSAVIDSDDEEDEEDDGEDLKDLINDEPLEEEKEDSEAEGSDDGGKRKHEDSEIDDQLSDEDYDLIEENLGIKVKRKHKRRRIRIASDDEESEKEGEQEAREVIERELFEGGDEAPGPDEERPAQDAPSQEFGDLEASDEESDVDDFIVDEDGQPISHGKKKKKHIIHTDAALQEAQDIFGVDFDFDEFEQYGDEYDDEEELEEDVYDEEEAEGEEGEGGETRRKTKKTSKRRSTKKTIFDVFEPSDLERAHFTDRDQEIRTADMPERFQLRRIPVRPTEEGELEEEAEWIFKYAFSTAPISSQEADEREGPAGQFKQFNRRGPNTVNRIREALTFMRNQQFEVPFIAFYRKEYVEPELNISDLWRVWQWDEKWTQLKTRKENLIRLFEKMQNYQFENNSDPDTPVPPGFRALTEEDIKRAREVQTMEELRDVYQHFLLHYGHEIPKMKNAQQRRRREPRAEGEEGAENQEEPEEDTEGQETLKQATRKSGYNICQQAGLDDLAKKFGLTPEQFGENLRDNYQRHEVEQYPMEPRDIAREFASEVFPSVEDVIKGAQHMVALQIAHDPLVRQTVRAVYYERAKITARPTKKGFKLVDESHACYTFKYLKNKPVRDLVGDMFLKIRQAADDGLIEYHLHIDEEPGSSDTAGSIQTYFEEIKQLYHRDEFSHEVQEWNNLRMAVVERALNKVLYPQIAKELSSKLIDEAKEGIIKACCVKLYNWLKVAPYQPDQQLDDDEDYLDSSHGLRVMGVAYSTDREVPAFCTMIDGDGQVTDFMRLTHLLKRRNAWREDHRKGKEEDLDKLREFISTKKPHVIAVSAESREATVVVEDIKNVVTDLEQEQQMAPINVEIVDNELAIIFQKTKKAEHDFREYPDTLRQAISIARRIQDPLVEFAQLCNPDEDILCLRYHPLQEVVNKEELLYALYLEFVNRVNEVGVDVNRCVTFPHTAPLVQFVCGLGQRKGIQLLKTLKNNNSRLENRTQLVTMCHMGPKVFINCAGFIKIDTNSLGDSTEAYVEVLDGSRVHPETYEWARKMAVDALEYDDTAEDANPAGALEEILESPERLKDLDLDAFAVELERQGYGNKHITLYDIRAELNHRYKDLRTPYRSPSNEEKFNMLTKETPETFYIGKLIMCQVTGIAHKRPQGDQLDQANPVRDDDTGLWQCPFCQKNDFPELSEVWSHFDAGDCPGQAVGVKTRLDNGVTGFIPTRLISDKHVKNPEERVKIHMTVHCRITKIDIDRFQVELTCKSSDLADKESRWKLQKDPYYDQDTEDAERTKEDEKKKQQARQTYVKRVIAHPQFQNIDYKKCEKLMANMEQGDVIIRPSSKGSDHLTVTWKVADEVLQHIDVREEGKENAFSLGQSLWIGGEEFEDLDEIIARHIQPMAAFARDILNYKYYFKNSHGGKREIVDKMLIDEKKKAPSRIPYYMSASRQYPGKFMLSYLPRKSTKHEFVTVTPEGVRYRGQMFHTLNHLVRWFKEHFRDPIPGTPSHTRTPLGMTSQTNATPSINLSNVDSATIQRAAAGLPSNIYNTLAQVAGTTPAQGFPNTGNFGGGFGGGFNFQGQQMTTPMMTPMLTPSYHAGQQHITTPAQPITTPAQPHITTPAHQPMTTPQYQPTPRAHFNHPGAATPGRTPRQQPPPHRTPVHPMSQPQAMPSRGPAHAATDWAKMAEMWAKRKQKDSRLTPRASPRPSPRPSQSPMVEGGGDTPLIDER